MSFIANSKFNMETENKTVTYVEVAKKWITWDTVKTWAIIILFAVCFFGFMIFSNRYKTLNEKYEKAIKEQTTYQRVIDSLSSVNKYNEVTITGLNDEIQTLNITISNLTKEKNRLDKKLKESQVSVTNNMSVATRILKANLSNEEL